MASASSIYTNACRDPSGCTQNPVREEPSVAPVETRDQWIRAPSEFSCCTLHGSFIRSKLLVSSRLLSQPNSGTNRASAQAMASPKLPNSHSNTTGGSSLNSYQRHNEIEKIKTRSGQDILRLPNDREITRSRSPSDIAAKLAAARYAPQKQQSPVATTGQIDRPQSVDQLLVKRLDAPTDTTSIASTDSLVNIFERKSRARPYTALTPSTIHTSNQDILFSKPLRFPVEGSVRLDGADATRDQRRSAPMDVYTRAQTANYTLSANQVSAQTHMPSEVLDTPTLGLGAPKPDAIAYYLDSHWRPDSQRLLPSSSSARDSSINAGRVSGGSPKIESITSGPQVIGKPPLPPPRRSSRLPQMRLREAPAAVSDRSTSKLAGDTGSMETEPRAGITAGTTRGSSMDHGSILPTGHARANGDKWRRTPLNTASPHLTEDSLADAIVASSLASSRAPSPTKLDGPPLPARHGKPPKAPYYNHQLESNLGSRTPSPAKGMRHTMRRPPSSDDEASNSPGGNRHGRRNILKKHPHKHHEGDRKRWRDEVTERERKRYEGVWAANKGYLIADPDARGALDESPLATAGATMVLNVVVREIWLRSRLPDSVLAQIWDLVDNQSSGMLSREEFVVGMWLIDQSLKGRKLPVKVSDSIWASVRQLSGIKLRVN